MKKSIFLTIIALIAASSFMTAAAANDINVLLNGNRIEFDTAPEIVSERTFVPLRAIAEALNSTVNWVPENKNITITKDAVTTVLAIDSTEVKTQTADKTMSASIEAPPYIKDDRTMVPLRFIAEAFDMNVNWDGETQTVTIDTIKTDTPIPTASPAASAEPSEIDKNKISYYSDFNIVPDFGACFGYEEDNKDQTHFYDKTTAEDRQGYINLLKSLDFKQVDEMVTSEVESYGFEKNGVQVVTSLFHIQHMEDLYGVSIQEKIENFTGEIKYYKNYKNVPDLGSLEYVKLIDTSDIYKNMTKYSYTVPDINDLTTVLMQYTNMLNQCGFSASMQNVGNAMFVNNDTENTVIIQVGLDSNNKTSIVITVEQWPDELNK